MTPWNAQSYDHNAHPQREWCEQVAERLLLRGNETVLDAGCGTGRLAELLAPRLANGTILCVDVSLEMLCQAEERLRSVRGTNLVLLQSDLTQLSVGRIVDVVVSSAVFHWVKDQDGLFQNLHRCLKPGGRLIAQCGGGPNLAKEVERTLRFLEQRGYSLDFQGDETPWVFQSKDGIAAVLHEAGFRDAEVWLENRPATFSAADSYSRFLSDVVLWPFLERIAPEDGRDLVKALTAAAANDDPPNTLDYWRLNLTARS